MKRFDSRLIVEIPEESHKKIRVSAAEKNISIKLWVIEAAFKKLQEENSDNIDAQV